MLAFRQALLGGAYPSAATLAGQFEVTVRTAQRDIEYLRDQLGWALEYDPARRGYRAAGPLPMADAVLSQVPAPCMSLLAKYFLGFLTIPSPTSASKTLRRCQLPATPGRHCHRPEPKPA
jgi:hypothetical protein